MASYRVATLWEVRDYGNINFVLVTRFWVLNSILGTNSGTGSWPRGSRNAFLGKGLWIRRSEKVVLRMEFWVRILVRALGT